VLAGGAAEAPEGAAHGGAGLCTTMEEEAPCAPERYYFHTRTNPSVHHNAHLFSHAIASAMAAPRESIAELLARSRKPLGRGQGARMTSLRTALPSAIGQGAVEQGQGSGMRLPKSRKTGEALTLAQSLVARAHARANPVPAREEYPQAALAKGYSSAIDSARIVHAAHATIAGLGADVWFEYVRTDANVSDEPSRVDLSRTRYELGAQPSSGVAAYAVSRPIETVLPTPHEWDADGVVWMELARSRRDGGF
jgi:hypothetical protein